jgi:hypothetical protein
MYLASATPGPFYYYGACAPSSCIRGPNAQFHWRLGGPGPKPPKTRGAAERFGPLPSRAPTKSLVTKLNRCPSARLGAEPELEPHCRATNGCNLPEHALSVLRIRRGRALRDVPLISPARRKKNREVDQSLVRYEYEAG